MILALAKFFLKKSKLSNWILLLSLYAYQLALVISIIMGEASIGPMPYWVQPASGIGLVMVPFEFALIVALKVRSRK